MEGERGEPLHTWKELLHKLLPNQVIHTNRCLSLCREREREMRGVVNTRDAQNVVWMGWDDLLPQRSEVLKDERRLAAQSPLDA